MKEKIIKWLDIEKPPLITKESEFVEGDYGANKITVELSPTYEGKTVEMLVGKFFDKVAQYYTGVVVGNKVSFDVTDNNLMIGAYSIFIRILDRNTITASCAIKYQVRCGRTFTDVTPPPNLSKTATELIEELKKQIIAGDLKINDIKKTMLDADDAKTRLERTIRTADTTKTNLQHVIDIAIVEEENLTAKTVIANTACANLDNKVIEANNSKKVLEAEIAKVPLEIKKLQDESNTQQELIRGEGTKQVKLVTDTGTLEVNKVTAEGNTQTNRVTAEGDSQFNRVNAEGTKQLGLITAEGVKQLDSVTGKGKEIIAAGNAKIEEIKSLPNGVGVNIKNGGKYRTWLGTVKEFNMIQKKVRGVLYHVFDSNFNMIKSYYEEEPVLEGLICWLDGREGKGTETIWNDRSGNMNSATLTGFSFTVGSGWTGKSLKFDGIKDKVILDNRAISWKTLEADFECNTSAVSSLLAYGIGWNKESFEVIVQGKYLTIQGAGLSEKIEFDNTRKNTLQLTYDKNILKIHLNGAYVSEVPGLALHVASRVELGVNANLDYYGNPLMNSVRLYNRVLNISELFANYEYDKTIDRTVPTIYPLTEEIENYGIGLSNQLSEEQLDAFRLSNDKTKFVAGLECCEGLTIDKYTYSKTLEIMETEDWKSKESYIS